MKRNKIPKIIGIALLIFICLLFLIPDLSLRAAVFWASPKSAFTMEYEEAPDIWAQADEPKDNLKIYRITKNAPSAIPDVITEDPSDSVEGSRQIWQIRSWGPFHVADYYGG